MSTTTYIDQHVTVLDKNALKKPTKNNNKVKQLENTNCKEN
jgi:hypothetical protein